VLAGLARLPSDAILTVDSPSRLPSLRSAVSLVMGSAQNFSCAVVGSSTNLLRAHLGAAGGYGAVIDSHDLVLRLNFAPATPKYAPNVGARTDVRIMAGNAWATPGARDAGLLLVQAPLPQAGDWSAKDRAAFAAVATANRLYRIANVASEIESGFGGLKFDVSSGFRAFLIGLRLCGSLSLFGFDLDSAAPGHYYSDDEEGIGSELLALARIEPERVEGAPLTLHMGDSRKPLSIVSERQPDGRSLPVLKWKKGWGHGTRGGTLSQAIRGGFRTDARSMQFVHNFAWERLVIRHLARSGCVSVQPWQPVPNASQSVAEALEIEDVIDFRKRLKSAAQKKRGTKPKVARWWERGRRRLSPSRPPHPLRLISSGEQQRIGMLWKWGRDGADRSI